MVSKNATTAHRKRSERWKEIVRLYRNRHRMWTMNVLPTMTEREWKQYTQWVADFGGSRQSRVKRRLTQARGTAVTATVTGSNEAMDAIQHAMAHIPSGVRTTRLQINLGQDKAVVRLYKNARHKNNMQVAPSASATRQR